MTIFKYRFLLFCLTAMLCGNAFSQNENNGSDTVLNDKITWHQLADDVDHGKEPFATVYVYRYYIPWLQACVNKMPIFVNDSLKCALKANTMVSFKIYKKGQQKFCGDKRGKTAMFVNVEPGKEYFFRCFLPGSPFSTVSMTNIKPEIARKELGLPD